MKSNTFRTVAISAASLVLGAAITGTALFAQDKPAADAKDAAPAVDPGKVVLKVGDSQMTAGEFNDFISGLPAEVQNMIKQGNAQKRRVAEDLVKLKLLAAEAKKKGLDQTPKFKQQMEMMRDNALAGALFQDIQGKLVGDEDIKKYYDEHKADFEKAKTRHILIATGENGLPDDKAQAKAQEIKARLDKGEDFAAIAKAESADPGSKEDGGQLPPFPRGQMVPEFEDAAFKMKPGSVSDPIKTKYGYHIIKLDSRDVPPLDDVKEEITEQLRPQKLDAMINGMKKDANVQLDESFFGPAQAAAAPAAGATEASAK